MHLNSQAPDSAGNPYRAMVSLVVQDISLLHPLSQPPAASLLAVPSGMLLSWMLLGCSAGEVLHGNFKIRHTR